MLVDDVYEQDEILTEDRQDELTEKIIYFVDFIDKVDENVIVRLCFGRNFSPSNFIILNTKVCYRYKEIR